MRNLRDTASPDVARGLISPLIMGHRTPGQWPLDTGDRRSVPLVTALLEQVEAPLYTVVVETLQRNHCNRCNHCQHSKEAYFPGTLFGL